MDSLTDELNRWLVPFFGSDLCLSYDIDSIPALAAKRESAWARLQNVDFLTLNEKRQSVGFPPIQGGDNLEKEKKQNDFKKSFSGGRCKKEAPGKPECT
ncbi:MAG: hypothetical protein GY915_07090 [bacterium]|nr:hypothetical protein [bacterium]